MAKWLEKEVLSKLDGELLIEEWQSARCSACGKYHTTPYMYYFYDYKYCPNCGARMDVEESEDKGVTDTERIERITKCLQKLGYPEMTRDELMEKVRNLSINEIEDEIWDMYCFVNDVCNTLNM